MAQVSQNGVVMTNEVATATTVVITVTATDGSGVAATASMVIQVVPVFEVILPEFGGSDSWWQSWLLPSVPPQNSLFNPIQNMLHILSIVFIHGPWSTINRVWATLFGFFGAGNWSSCLFAAAWGFVDNTTRWANYEYAGILYTTTQLLNGAGYSYSQPKVSFQTSAFIFPWIAPPSWRVVAAIHTHPHLVGYDGNNFSPGDKYFSRDRGMPIFLVTPAGALHVFCYNLWRQEHNCNETFFRRNASGNIMLDAQGNRIRGCRCIIADSNGNRIRDAGEIRNITRCTGCTGTCNAGTNLNRNARRIFQ